MGGALLAGWQKMGLDPGSIVALDPAPTAPMRKWCAEQGVQLVDASAALKTPEALVLAVKPQTFEQAVRNLGSLADSTTLVISIMAGKRLADIAERLPLAGAFVRAMPNTPGAIGEGVAGAVAGPSTDPGRRAAAEALLAALGPVVWLDDEAQMDAVTAVSGSGPAYVFYLVECLARAGADAGLPVDVALRLARKTVEGAGALLAHEPATSVAQLREDVTSPGGTTAAALDVLMAPDGLGALMRRAVEEARKRSAELAG